MSRRDDELSSGGGAWALTTIIGDSHVAQSITVARPYVLPYVFMDVYSEAPGMYMNKIFNSCSVNIVKAKSP